MKRVVLSIVILLILLCGIAVAESATIVASGNCGAYGYDVTWELDSAGVLTISGEGEMGNYAFYDTSVQPPWYAKRTSIRTAMVEAGVTSIGTYAFRDCSSLSSITIPEGVTDIGQYTFYNCSNLGSIDIPTSVTSIGISAFYGCSSLSRIDIPAGVTKIEGSVFSGCSGLSSITLPEGVTSIGGSAFKGCSSLSSIDIPTSVTSIGGSAFSNCSGLSSITIPTGVTSISKLTFDHCSSLSSIAIPESVTTIAEGAFRSCSSLGNIVLPASLSSISDYTFQYCKSLSSIDLPAGVTSIGVAAFDGCSSLGSIDIPTSVTSIGGSAFSNCSSLSSIAIPTGVTSIGQYTFSNCSSLSSIALPSRLSSIGDSAFSDCGSLSRITFPADLTSIGSRAFVNCRSLTSIVIPEGVTSIGSEAFRDCSSLRRIDIPESVTSIGSGTFRRCDAQASVLFRGYGMPSVSGTLFSGSPTIYCHEYSDADFWATEEGYARVYIDGMDLSKPISIDLPEDMRLAVGERSTQMSAIFPENAGRSVFWRSSDPSVVSVENGVLTANAVGKATITASCDEVSDQLAVTVYLPPKSFALSEEELWVISKGTAQLSIRDMQPAEASASFTWESSDTSVLTVKDGKISALKPGDAIVSVTSENGVVRTCLVHVCYPVTAITLEKSAYQLRVGEESQITAHVTMGSLSLVNRFVAFTSSDEAVATVDAAGCIRAVAPGTATISVSSTNGISASCTVEVVSCIHKPVTDPAVPATHVTTGLTEGSHCSLCSEILVAQEEIPVVEVPVIALPAGLEAIEAEAFAGDTFVCAVLPKGCRAIGAGAFMDCAQLCFVEIPESVTSIDESAFEGCGDGLIIVTVSGSTAANFAKAHDITCVLRASD